MVHTDSHRNGKLRTKSTFLHNTKLSSSKYNEKKTQTFPYNCNSDFIDRNATFIVEMQQILTSYVYLQYLLNSDNRIKLLIPISTMLMTYMISRIVLRLKYLTQRKNDVRFTTLALLYT